MSRFKNDLKVDEQRRAPAWGAGAPGSACEQSTVFEEGITANQEAMESARLMLQVRFFIVWAEKVEDEHLDARYLKYALCI